MLKLTILEKDPKYTKNAAMGKLISEKWINYV